MTTDDNTRACAGMLLVVGRDVNRVRHLMAKGLIDLNKVHSDVPLFGSYDEMAEANGYAPPAD